MTLTEHLEDLRWCLLKSVLAIILASTIGYLFSDSVFSFIVAPLRQSLQPGQNLIGTSVTEAFFVEIKVALAAGVLFACPVIFYQIWRFIAPGLSKREKKWVVPFVLCATLFFVGGSLFCYRFVLPVAFKLFHRTVRNYGREPGDTDRRLFHVFLSHGVGVWRDFRVAGLYFFSSAGRRVGLPLHAALVPLCHWCAIFIIAAILTPTPDVINQCLLAGPMLLLYILSIGVAYVWRKTRMNLRSE